MSPDRAGLLIDRVLALRDPAFVAPPFSAAVAEEVLGASGRPLTPHRRLLERANGCLLHDHALHLLGACESPPWHSLRAWNRDDTWRGAYGGAAEGLTFFAEDAFGDQFAYLHAGGAGGEVVVFEAELGRVGPCASSFVEWLEEMLERPAELLPLDVMARERAEQHPHAPGTHLFAYPPLFSPEAQAGVSIGHVDAIEAMRFRGQLAHQLRDLRPGTRVRIDLEGDLGGDPDGDGEGAPGGKPR